MPACLQPRAVASWTIIDDHANRPVSRSRGISRLRPGRSYSFEIGPARDGILPESVAASPDSLVRIGERVESNASEPAVATRYRFAIDADRGGRTYGAWSWSRFENAAVTVSYGDGRSALGLSVPVLISPPRRAALVLMILLASLCVAIPAVTGWAIAHHAVSSEASRTLQACTRVDIGIGCAAAVFFVGLVPQLADRMLVRRRVGRYRAAQRRDIAARAGTARSRWEQVVA